MAKRLDALNRRSLRRTLCVRALARVKHRQAPARLLSTHALAIAAAHGKRGNSRGLGMARSCIEFTVVYDIQVGISCNTGGGKLKGIFEG